MIIDMNYWSKVLKKTLIVGITGLGIYLSFRLAYFYLPFLIAFILSLFLEPIIKYLMKKMKIKRKFAALIVFVLSLSIIVGLIIWGIATLISESYNLLNGINEYIPKVSELYYNIVNKIDFNKINLSKEVTNAIQSSSLNLIDTVVEFGKNVVTNILEFVTSIPTIAIYTVITFLSLYFICTDKIYMIDQMEHHLPKIWVKRIGKHIREIIKSLGSYLKAQAILICISFIISIIGLYIFKFIGLNIKYPLLAAIGIGFVDALPIFGSGTVMVPWAIISALNGDIVLALSILGLLIFMSIVRQIVEPKIVSGQIGIHPIFTLIAMYTGFKFIGVLGMLIGPILLIILKNIFGTLIDKGVMKSIFEREG